MAFFPEVSKKLISVSGFIRTWRKLLQLAGASRPALALFAQDLGKLADRIPAISQEIGVRYVHSSSVLDPLTNASDALTAQSAELLKLAIGQADGDLVVSGTTDLLTPPFSYLDGWRVEVHEYVAQLASCEEVFARLAGSQTSLNGLVSPLKHIQTMFRIEAARLPEEVRQIFAGLTEQIAAVHDEVNETFAGQFQIVSQTLSTLEHVRQKISGHADRLRQGLADRRSRVAESLEKLRHELARNSERETQLAQTSNAIATSTMDVVVSLQAHDICNQRLEHVCVAITEARRILGSSWQELRRDKQALQQAWGLLMVQSAQVDDIYKQFESSERSLQTAVQNIASKVVDFDDECILLKEFQEVTVATNGSVELSLEMMQEVAGLLRGVIAASHDFCRSIQPVSNMTARLTDALESLSIKMQLIALNAQVQAVHIGSGTGLEVLAAQTAAISNQTSRNAEHVSEDMQSLVRVVRDLTSSLQRITAEGEAALQQFEENSQAHESTLHRLRDKTLQQLQMVGKAVDDISTCARELREDSQVRQSAVSPLEKLALDLRTISEQIKSSVGDLELETATNLKTNYKMKSERQVHKDALVWLGRPNANETPSAESPATEQAETSIELF